MSVFLGTILCMFWKRNLFLFVLWASMAHCLFAIECGNSPAKTINLDLASTRSLLSPDQQWLLISIGPHGLDQPAHVYIQNRHNSQKWQIGLIERHAIAFWSEDSKRLFLRDQYAADDTRIRVFDFTHSVPKEIRGLDHRIRRTIFSRIPEDETTLWLYYPEVCFAAGDSSIIIVVANAPLVRKRESSEGKDFSLKLTVDLISFRIATSGTKAPTFP